MEYIICLGHLESLIACEEEIKKMEVKNKSTSH